MPFFARSLCVIAACSLALASAGCTSNNKGKIEGRWKIVSAPQMDTKELESLKLYAYIEFGADGSMSIGAASTDPSTQKVLDSSSDAKGVRCKYRLLSGDKVEFYDLPKDMQKSGGGGLFGNKSRSQTQAKIVGDDMTMVDDDGTTVKLSRVK